MIVSGPETCLKVSGYACLPGEAILPERGVTVSHMQHRGLAGVEPGHYRGMVSDRTYLL